MAERITSGWSVGTRVAFGLGVLTAIEYLLAIASVPGLLLVLAVLAVAKAWLIVIHFMHIRQLRLEGST